MEVLYPRCCGLDVHLRFVLACLITLDAQGQRHKELRRFGTSTPELLALVDWLQAAQCSHVAMESTGVYWKPVYNLLEGLFEVLVVNAQHMKAVPGRKTDVKDAEWIADLLQHGLLKASFIPTVQQRDLRDLTRYRSSLIQERTRTLNRVHKVLEGANVKLSTVLSDIDGVSGRRILEAMARGETNPEVLADLAHVTVRASRQERIQALTGRLRDHHRFLLQELLDHLAHLDRATLRLDREIGERMRPFEEQIRLVDGITGLSRQATEALLAEVGWDMAPFPDAAHAASWVGICPGQHESAGKRQKGTMRKGNRYARTILVQAAHATRRTKTYLGAQYRRLAKRRGPKRAAVAVGHSILVIVYHVLTTGQPYQEKGADYFETLSQQRAQRRLIAQVEALGYQVIAPAEQNSA